MSNRRASPPASPRAARPATPRELAKLRTREALLDAAIAAFSEQGLDAPSLDQICARAGCTRGAFYVHFRDRDDLIVAAMERRRGTVLAHLLEVPAGTASVAQILELFALAFEGRELPVEGAVRTAELLAAMRRSPTIRDAQLRLMQATVDRLEKHVRADQSKRSVRADVGAAALARILLVLEAGAELVLDLGYPLDVRQATMALSTLLSTDASSAHARRPRRRPPKR